MAWHPWMRCFREGVFGTTYTMLETIEQLKAVYDPDPVAVDDGHRLREQGWGRRHSLRTVQQPTARSSASGGHT